MSLLFVSRIIAAGTVGAGHGKLDLFTIHFVPVEGEMHGAHIHDAATVSANFHCLLARRGRLCSRCNDDAVDAVSISECADLLSK